VPARPPLTTRMPESIAKLQEGRVQPHGEKAARNMDARYKPLVEVDMLAHGHPAYHPRLMYYNV
jgi:hypothetical protein